MSSIKQELENLVKTRGISDEQLKAIVEAVLTPPATPTVHSHNWSSSHVRFGLCGDWHVGSTCEDLDSLVDLFKRYKRSKVDAVYVTGDVTEGYNMRPGHSLEVLSHGADAQVERVVSSVPAFGFPVYFIGGNHDYSHWKRQGVDVCAHVSALRDDLHYLGSCVESVVQLTGSSSLMLLHPSRGSAYALSYAPQKIIESLTGGEKPNILAIGHFHKAEYLEYRNVHCFQTACLQSQTEWMRSKSLAAIKGGWLLDVFFKSNGHPDRVDMSFFPY